MKPEWKAEQTASPQAAEHGWAIIYDPTPGGRLNEDGSRSYSMRFPALLLAEFIDDPEAAATEIAEMLNEAETARAEAGSS